MSGTARTFDLYAAYYDLLYGGKDYAAEAGWVRALLPPQAHEVLELGCGTGGHAVVFAEAGLQVRGVDLSPAMVGRAQARRAALAPEVAQRLAFECADARSFRAERTFDAVVSLFHVASYQTSLADLLAYLATARAHLRAGGLFVFDFWYGPAVLTDRPRHVVREVADDRIAVRRETTPTVHVNANRVDVRFDVTIRAQDGSAVQSFDEVHAMRYLFLPELDALFAQTGFERSAARGWLSATEPDDRTWYACVVARAA